MQLLASIQRTVPSIFKWLGIHHYKLFEGTPFEMGHHEWGPIAFAWLAGILLVISSYGLTTRLKKVPGLAQGLVEMAFMEVYDFFESVLGEHTDRYMPLLGSMFIYILTMNYLPVIPGMHAPTAALPTTAALAIVTFCATHYEGVRENGFFGYLKHFAEPLYLAPLMIIIHVVEELVRPLSLAARLFGNIMGEDTLMAAIVSIMVLSGPFFFIPAQFPLFFLMLLAGLIQAAIFTILSAVYIAGAIGAFDPDH